MRVELGDQFWEMVLDGTRLRIRHGKVGTDGTAQVRSEPSEAEAQQEYDRLAAEFERRGYRPPVPVEEPEPPGRPVPSNPELEAAIEDDPDDDTRRLVYADWLQQQGDPRGELATVQHALAGAPTDELRAREKSLLERYREHLLGPIGPLVESARPAFAHQHWAVHGMDPKWRCGFLDSIRISAWNEMGGDIRAILRTVLGHPSTRFLRDLRFGMTTNDYGPLYDSPGAENHSLLDVLIDHALPALRRIEFGALDFAGGEMEYSWVGLGNLGKVLARYPRLHEVVLAGSGAHSDAHYYDDKKITPNPLRLSLGAIELPELRRFVLRTTDLHRTVAAELASARWPKLQELELWFGARTSGGDCKVDDAIRILDAVPPGVTTLGLMNAEFADDLITPLAAHPALARLRRLDLSLGCLSDAGAEEIAYHTDAFAHLDRLNVENSYLTSDGRAAIAKVCREVEFGDQREADEEDDEGDGRYVAVWE